MGSQRRTQNIAKHGPRVQLSKDARIAVKAHRQAAARLYRTDLEDAWTKMRGITEDLAVNHHKSIRRVQTELNMSCGIARFKHKKTNAWNAFCWKKRQDKENNSDSTLPLRCLLSWLRIFADSDVEIQGKEVLQRLVHDHRSEYQNLTPQQQNELVAEFEEHKSEKATALRVSVKSRLKDVSHTLSAVEQEVTTTCLYNALLIFFVLADQLEISDWHRGYFIHYAGLS